MNIWEQLENIKGKLNYTIQVLENGNLEAWEIKEFLNLEAYYKKQIAELEKAIVIYNETYLKG